jgi:O-antigen/teichoic acid export membrane protein
MSFKKKSTSNTGYLLFDNSNTSWLLIDKTLKTLSSIIIGLILARHYGPEVFGDYSYIISVIFILVAISSLGLDGIIVRETNNNDSNIQKILGTSFYLKFFTGSIILIISSVFILINNDGDYPLLLLIFLLTLPFYGFNIVDFYFQSISSYKYIAKLNLYLNIFSLLVKLIIISYDLSIIFIGVSFIADILFQSIIFCFLLSKIKNIKISDFVFDLPTAKKLLKDSYPLIFSSFFISLNLKMDQILLGELTDNYNLGLYASSVRISEAWYFIPAALSNAFMPQFMKAKRISVNSYNKIFHSAYKLMLIFSVTVAIIFSLFSSDIIYLLFGSEYLPASPVLKIHVWSGVFASMGFINSKFQIIENYTKFSLYRNIFGFFINFVLNLLLIPKYGIFGCAIATLVGVFCSAIIFDLFYKDLRKHLKIKLLIYGK